MLIISCVTFCYQDVATEIATLSKQLAAGDFSKLKDARKAVLGLKAPKALVGSLYSLFLDEDSIEISWHSHVGIEKFVILQTSVL